MTNLVCFYRAMHLSAKHGIAIIIVVVSRCVCVCDKWMTIVVCFYRAMHLSAKRGIAITWCPSVPLSVRLSVCDIGGSGPHRLEILKTNCTDTYPNTFALGSPKAIHLLPGEHVEILGRLEVGWEKVVCWSTKAAISLKRV